MDGAEYWVSAWKRKPDANPKAPALSFSIKLKESQAEQAKQAIQQPVDEAFDDDIPF